MNFNIAGNLFGYLRGDPKIQKFGKALLNMIYEAKVNYLISGVANSLEIRCLCEPTASDFIYISKHTLERITNTSNCNKEKKEITRDIKNRFKGGGSCSVGILSEIMRGGSPVQFEEVKDKSLQEILNNSNCYLKQLLCFYVPIDEGIVRLCSSKTDLMINGFYGRKSHIKEYFDAFEYIRENRSKKRHIISIKIALNRFNSSER